MRCPSADDLAARIGQRKLRQREQQLQQQKQEQLPGSPAPASPLSVGRSRPASPGGGGPVSPSGSGGRGQPELRSRSPKQRHRLRSAGRGPARAAADVDGRAAHPQGWSDRSWSPKRDGAAWGTLGGAGERGTAHSPGADHADRADWCAHPLSFLRNSAST